MHYKYTFDYPVCLCISSVSQLGETNQRLKKKILIEPSLEDTADKKLGLQHWVRNNSSLVSERNVALCQNCIYP